MKCQKYESRNQEKLFFVWRARYQVAPNMALKLATDCRGYECLKGLAGLGLGRQQRPQPSFLKNHREALTKNPWFPLKVSYRHLQT